MWASSNLNPRDVTVLGEFSGIHIAMFPTLRQPQYGWANDTDLGSAVRLDRHQSAARPSSSGTAILARAKRSRRSPWKNPDWPHDEPAKPSHVAQGTGADLDSAALKKAEFLRDFERALFPGDRVFGAPGPSIPKAPATSWRLYARRRCYRPRVQTQLSQYATTAAT
jgi:hypothetical protein